MSEIEWPAARTRAADPADTEAKKELEFDASVDMDNELLDAGQSLENSLSALLERVAELENAAQAETRGLVIRQSRVSPATDVFITAERLAMQSGEWLNDVSVGVDLGNSGAGGLDTGTVQPNTWYYFFVITDDSDTLPDNGIASTLVSPVIPSGFDRASAPLLLMLTDSQGHLHAFQHLADGTTLILSNEEGGSAVGSAVDRLDLGSVGGGWTDTDLSSIQPPGCDDILVRFYGVATDDHTKLYGKPTWAEDAGGGDGYSYQRRLFELNAAGLTSEVPETCFIANHQDSPDRWLELDNDGHYSFSEGGSGHPWYALYASLVGWKFRP